MLIIPWPMQVTEEALKISNYLEVWHFFVHR